jgi:hypothetical protein
MDFLFGTKTAAGKAKSPFETLMQLDPRNQAAQGQAAELAPALKANGGGQPGNAAQIAQAGTASGGQQIPYRAEMEASFGRDFSNVQAHFGDAAKQSSDALGAHAYAMGNRVAFADPNPSKALVAHELTHVVQQTEGPQRKATDEGVSTAGEAQAEAVEAAVAAGLPAHTVLGNTVEGLPVAPALKTKDPKQMGICQTVSHSGVGIDRSVPIWEGSWPIGTIPPVVFNVEAGIAGTLNTSINWSEPGASASGVVEGNLGLKATLGPDNDIASLYAEAMGEAKGGLTVSVEKANGFSIGLTAEIGGRLSAGIELLGVLQKRYDPVSITFGTLKGIQWNSQKGIVAGVWEWGPEIQAFVDWVKEQIDFTKNVIRLAGSAAKAIVVLQALKTKGEQALRDPARYLPEILKTIPDVSPIPDDGGGAWDWINLPWPSFQLPEIEINYGKLLRLGGQYLRNYL